MVYTGYNTYYKGSVWQVNPQLSLLPVIIWSTEQFDPYVWKYIPEQTEQISMILRIKRAAWSKYLLIERQ